MNKIIKSVVATLAILFSVTLLNSDVYAASVTLTGPTTVRAGDSIKINIKIAEAGRNAIEGTFSYDSNMVTLSGVTSARTGWKVETNGNTMMSYDENMTNATTANSVVATATFKVKSTVTAGTTLKISLTNTSVSAQGGGSFDIGTVTYSVTIAQPLSTVNTLSALTVDGYTLSPTFSSSTTTYNIGEVDFGVSSLKITATPTDSKAKATISGNSLAVGANTVTITVKAENGSTKTYQIKVTRKQDPNYVASSNAAVSQMTASSGKLSPIFSSDVTEYVVYVPYEEVGSRFEISGKASDTKATGVQSGVIEALVAGNNTTKLVCTAEDGSTMEYNVTVVVMPQYDGNVPVIGENDTEEPTTPEETPEETPAETPNETPEANEQETTPVPTEPTTDDETSGESTPTWIYVALVIGGIAAGFGICFLVMYLKNKKED